MSKDAEAVKEVSPGYGLKSARSALPNGYKQTEAGIIPDEWEIKRLREISPRQSVGLVINPSTYFNRQGTVPMLVGSNVYENRIDWSAARRITKESNEKLPASQLFPDDLVTVRVGDPGITAVIPADTGAANCASMMIVRGDKSFVSDWLCYLMNSDYGRNQVKNVQYGTAQKQFNISDAVDFIYPVPPIEEQRAIATALSDVDALLEELDRLIAKKRDLKQATMQQLLTGQTRLPGFEGEWEDLTLGDVVERFIGGGTPSRSNATYWGGSIPWVTVKDLATFNPYQAQEAITETGLRKSASNLIPAGTVITSTRMALGKAVIYRVDVSINQDMKALVTNSKLLPVYLLNWFSANGEVVNNAGGGSTVKGISVHQLRQLPISLPPVEEQTAIANAIQDIDAEIQSLKERRQKSSLLKQAMMQDLLTGRTRLVCDENTDQEAIS